MDQLVRFVPLIALFVLMYFILIRPQKKKEKEVSAMRNRITVGDEVVTIGGICGKVVKTKDETLVIQVGADKVKFEMMRWAISKVVNSKYDPSKEDVTEETEPVAAKPKRLKKKEDIVEEPTEAVEETKEEDKETVSE